MLNIDTIIQDDIKYKLENISVANGFLNDISVLPGYMVHYANDLMSAKAGSPSFPAVSFQPLTDDISPDQSQTKSRNERIMRVIGAVDVIEHGTVNERINSLLFDVRRALAMDKFDNQSLATGIELGSAEFNLNDSQAQYAFFEMNITIKYIEVWK